MLVGFNNFTNSGSHLYPMVILTTLVYAVSGVEKGEVGKLAVVAELEDEFEVFGEDGLVALGFW